MKPSKPLNLQEHRRKKSERFVCRAFCSSLLNFSKQVYISNFTDNNLKKNLYLQSITNIFALFVFTTRTVVC